MKLKPQTDIHPAGLVPAGFSRLSGFAGGSRRGMKVATSPTCAIPPFFCRANSRDVAPKCGRSLLHSASHRHFGMNTTGSLHSHSL